MFPTRRTSPTRSLDELTLCASDISDLDLLKSPSSICSEVTLFDSSSEVKKRLCIGAHFQGEEQDGRVWIGFTLFLCDDPAEPATFYTVQTVNKKRTLYMSTKAPLRRKQLILYVTLPCRLTDSQLRDFVQRQELDTDDPSLTHCWTSTHWVCRTVQRLAEDRKIGGLVAPTKDTIAEEIWDAVWTRIFAWYKQSVSRPDNESRLNEKPRYDYLSGDKREKAALKLVKSEGYHAPPYRPRNGYPWK